MRSAGGDDEFEQFVLSEMAGLHRLAWVLARNEHDAWDLVQECFARMRPKWERVSARDDPGLYARKVVVNLNLNRLRRARREVLRDVHADLPASVADTSRVEWLDDALARMPGRQRVAATLAYVDDMSVTDIARVMACSESSVKTHLSRARRVLRVAASDAEVAVADDGGSRA